HVAPGAAPALARAFQATPCRRRPGAWRALRPAVRAWSPRRSLAALGVPDQALALRDLALAEHVLAVLVGVLAFAEHEAHRRTHQLEALAEEVLEVAPVAVGQGAQPRAVDHDRRRGIAAGVREAPLGGMVTHPGRRAGLLGQFVRAVSIRLAQYA